MDLAKYTVFIDSMWLSNNNEIHRPDHSPLRYLSSKSQIPLREYGSTPAVGSSKTTTLEPPTKAIATDSFLCIPPDRDTEGGFGLTSPSTKYGHVYIQQSNYQAYQRGFWSVHVVYAAGRHLPAECPAQLSLLLQTNPWDTHKTTHAPPLSVCNREKIWSF